MRRVWSSCSGFGADGEGVEEIEAGSEIECLVLAVTKVVLAEDFLSMTAMCDGSP